MEHVVLRQLRQLAQSYHMLPPNSLILTAVSGGGDSMCLLHALLSQADFFGITVAAAHFNHHLRPEAAEEQAFVQRWCAARHVPCYVGQGDVGAAAAAAGCGIEETARTLRYAFLETTAKEIGAARIATAHHGDDNAETLLLHLVRGSGRKGLGGIPPVRGTIIRPLLTVERRDIQDYLACCHIPHVEDASNADPTYTRNYLRQEILPRLKQINPNLNARLWESACQFRQEDAYLEEQAQQLVASHTQTETTVTLSCAPLTQASEALSLRGIQLLAQSLDPELVLSSRHRRAVLTLCQSDTPSGQLSLPNGIIARRSYDRLELMQPADHAPTFTPVPLALPGVTETAGWRFTCQYTLCPAGKYNQPRKFYLTLPTGVPVTLRPRQTGDVITLPSRNRKTLKKLLIDAKIPRRIRELLPVFDCAGVVCALTEFGADQAFLPRPGTSAWQISVTRLTPS